MISSKAKLNVGDAALFGVGQGCEAYDALFQFLERKTPEQYDRIMDAVYNNSSIGGGFHRTFDGTHTLHGSYKAIYESAGEVEVIDFIRAHFNELVTPEGCPILTLNHEAHHAITNDVSASLGNVVTPGQLRAYIRDMNSINAPELMAGGIGIAFMFAAIRSDNPKAISRVVAGNLCVGLMIANPLQIFTGLCGLAYGVKHKKIHSWEILRGAAPAIGGVLGYQICNKALGFGASSSLAISLATGVAINVMLDRIEETKKREVMAELGSASQYVPVLTPQLLQSEIAICEMKRNSLTIAI